jgi:hypothetical protein
MTKKMLLLSVPLALMLTACNGDDRRPTASLPNNPSQPSNPGQPTNTATTVTATQNNDDLAVAARAETNIATNSSAAIRGNYSNDEDTDTAASASPTVAVQFLAAASEEDNDQAKLTVDGTVYTLTRDGNDYYGENNTGNTYAYAEVQSSGNQQSGVARYDVGTDNETEDGYSGTYTSGYAAFGALTPESRVPTRNTATYTGGTEIQIAQTLGGGYDTLNGTAVVRADFGANAGNRFNGTTFTYGDGDGGTVGTLTARDGSSTTSGNAFSSSLNASGFEGTLGNGGSGTMNGNFFGDRAEEVAGTISASGNGHVAAGGFSASTANTAQPPVILTRD